MGELYFKHFVNLDPSGRVVRGFSSAFEKPVEDSICITEKGGYQFKLFGVENPLLFTDDGIPAFKYDGGVVERTAAEIEADRALLPVLDAATADELLNILLGVSE